MWQYYIINMKVTFNITIYNTWLLGIDNTKPILPPIRTKYQWIYFGQFCVCGVFNKSKRELEPSILHLPLLSENENVTFLNSMTTWFSLPDAIVLITTDSKWHLKHIKQCFLNPLDTIYFGKTGTSHWLQPKISRE